MELPLSNGETVIIDDSEYQNVGQKKWHRVTSTGLVKRGYREGKQVKSESLAAAITGHKLKPSEVFGFVNGDKSDFRLENIIVKGRGDHLEGVLPTPREIRERAKKTNATGFVGVQKVQRKYSAIIRGKAGKRANYLGLFTTPEEAAQAYDDALISQGLEPVNFPNQDYVKPAGALLSERQRELIAKKVAEFNALMTKIQHDTGEDVAFQFDTQGFTLSIQNEAVLRVGR